MPGSKSSSRSLTSKVRRRSGGGGRGQGGRSQGGGKEGAWAAHGDGAAWAATWRWLVGGLVTLSALASLFFFLRGNTLWFGDAEAHLNIARRIVDSRTPGYEQIGTVWLPLPHLLVLPLVWFNRLWQTGLAGAMASGGCYVAAGCFLWAAVRRTTASEAAAWAAAGLFALNPNVLYLQATPMTESVLWMCGLGTLWATTAAGQAGGERMALRWGAVAGLFLLAGTMTRYEGWFLIPWACLYLLFRAGLPAAVLAGALAAIGPLFWLFHNQVFHGDWLAFYQGEGSAKWIYQSSLDRPGAFRYPGDGDWAKAFRYYAEAGLLVSGWPLVAIGVAGYGAALWRRWWWLVGFLTLTPLFYVWSMHGSGTPIFVPTLWPNSFYNTRYGMAVVLLLAAAGGALVAAWPARWQKAAAIAALVVASSPWVFYPQARNWVTFRESQVNSEARRAWTQQAAAYLGPKYLPGRGIVIGFGDQTGILRTAGIPLAESVHEGNGLRFEATLQRPELFLWQEWAVAFEGDRLDKAMGRVIRMGAPYQRAKIIEVEGAARVMIYRRTPRS